MRVATESVFTRIGLVPQTCTNNFSAPKSIQARASCHIDAWQPMRKLERVVKELQRSNGMPKLSGPFFARAERDSGSSPQTFIDIIRPHNAMERV